LLSEHGLLAARDNQYSWDLELWMIANSCRHCQKLENTLRGGNFVAAMMEARPGIMMPMNGEF
jgi:hypothetical protein